MASGRIERWNANGSDMSVDLRPGHVLILPRGRVHNRYDEYYTESIHLPFVIKERTPLWIAEHSASAVIAEEAFRYSIPVSDLEPAALAMRMEQTRNLLTRHPRTLDVDALGRWQWPHEPLRRRPM